MGTPFSRRALLVSSYAQIRRSKAENKTTQHNYKEVYYTTFSKLLKLVGLYHYSHNYIRSYTASLQSRDAARAALILSLSTGVLTPVELR